MMTRRHRAGLGILPYFDVGEGITPANFASMCCEGGSFYGNVDECVRFLAANGSLFGKESPCSADGLKNLTFPGPAPRVIPVPPPAISVDPRTYGQAVNPCTGRVVSTVDDALELETCLARIQAGKQAALVLSTATDTAAAQCAAMAAECANRTFAPFLKVSADCSGCDFNFVSRAAVLTGVGLLVGLVVLKKVL